MMRLTGQIGVVAVGKMRTKHWLTAQNEYLKRLQRYGNVKLHEVKDVVGRSVPDAVGIEREGEQLLNASKNAQRLILLTPTGKLLSSEGLARFLHQRVANYGNLAFLIGGPIGFSSNVTNAAQDQISLSPLTFTHEMARVLLLEQLYRACTILNNEKYHK